MSIMAAEVFKDDIVGVLFDGGRKSESIRVFLYPRISITTKKGLRLTSDCWTEQSNYAWRSEHHINYINMRRKRLETSEAW